MHRFRFGTPLLACLAVLLCTSGTLICMSRHTAFATSVRGDQVATATTSSDWTMFNLHHARFNAGEQTINPHNVSSLTLAWSATPSTSAVGGPMTEPAVANGLVYTTTPKSTPKNMLDALDAHTGTVVWQRELLSRDGPDGGRYYLSVVNGLLYITDGPSIEAYNAATGTLVWSKAIAPEEGMVVDQGMVYVESVLGAPQGQSSLYALNAQTGHTHWHVVVAPLLSSASPAVANGMVYVGAEDGTLLAFNANNGTQRWATSLGANNAIITAPVVDNGTVFVEADSTGLFAFDAQTGHQRWFAPSDPYGGSPAVAYGLVYVVEGIGAIQAYNETTGALVWQQNQSPINTLYAATVANGVVYASATSGGPIAFNARTGKHLYTFNNHPTHGTSTSAPVVAEGMIFFNMLYTYDETDALKLP